MVVTMTAGTAVIMWLGELITERGIGNGMSLLIFTQVVADLPGLAVGGAEVAGLVGLRHGDRDRPGDHRGGHLHRAGPAPDPGAVRPPDGRPQDVRRQLDVHPAQGQPGRRHPGHLRLVAALPAGAWPRSSTRPATPGGCTWINDYLVRGNHPLYMIAFFLLIVFFTYFYVSITFNPEEVADNMKKYGGFIPGIRAGKPTEDYLVLRPVPHHAAGCALPRSDRR